jgi:kynurenine formamidase
MTTLPSTRPYDLGQPYFTGMPHYPTHPPFLFSLTKVHGEVVLSSGASSAADAIALGTHVGTHIDSLSHFSCNGICFGGKRVEQSYASGMSELSVETIEPIVRRGVLLDVAGSEGMDALPDDFEIMPEHFERAQRCEIREGDVVLFRTGWSSFYEDARRYVNGTKGPGPGLAGAQWLSSKKVHAAGADTVAFEKSPSDMEVHLHLLVDSGIYIIEVLNLEELARDKVYEFTFVAAPMKIRGATGAPVRPLAFPPAR